MIRRRARGAIQLLTALLALGLAVPAAAQAMDLLDLARVSWRRGDLETSDALSEALAGSADAPTSAWEGDGRLHRAAWSLLRLSTGLGGARIDGLMETITETLRLADPLMVPVEASGPSRGAAIAALAKALTHELKGVAFNRIGVAAASSGARWRVLALLVNRRAEVEEAPPFLPLASTYALRAEILDGGTHPRVLVLRPDRTIEEIPVHVKGRHILAYIPVNQRGRHRVELLLDGSEGEPTLPAALFSLWTRRPRAASREPRHGGATLVLLPRHPARQSRARISAELRRWTDQLRKEQGLEALWSDPRLDDVAEALAQDLAARHTLDHRDSSRRPPLRRLHDAGLEPRAYGENVAAAYSVSGIQRSILASPSHLRTVLQKEANRMGVGVSLRDGVIFVVQILAQL